MDNLWLVNAAENGLEIMPGVKKSRGFREAFRQTEGLDAFFLETFGAVLAREAATARGDILAFSVAEALAIEVLLLPAVTTAEEDTGGLEGFFFVISS